MTLLSLWSAASSSGVVWCGLRLFPMIYRAHCGNNMWNRPVFKSCSARRGAGGGSEETEYGGPVFSREPGREDEASQRYHWALRRTGKVGLGVRWCLLIMPQSNVFTLNCEMYVRESKICFFITICPLTHFFLTSQQSLFFWNGSIRQETMTDGGCLLKDRQMEYTTSK